MTHLADGPAPAPVSPRVSPGEFAWISEYLRERTGIELKDGKQPLVVSRLSGRLRATGSSTFGEYFRLLADDSAPEAQLAVDLLTTNETYFFREPQHFDLLPQLIPDGAATRPVRVWSAASSSGEEAYSAAMTLAECMGHRPWEIVGTDISSRVVEVASRALYPIEASANIPDALLRRYCMKGSGSYEGMFTLRPGLRSRVSFQRCNLFDLPATIGAFDVIFLRNVMIYFGPDNKRRTLHAVLDHLGPGGVLLIGHAESVTGLIPGLLQVAPSVFRLER